MANFISKKGFAGTPLELVNNPNISWRAKGLFAYLQGKPEGWDFSIERIALNATEGEKATRTAIQELEKAGFLERKRTRKGRKWEYQYILHWESKKEKKDCEPPVSAVSQNETWDVCEPPILRGSKPADKDIYIKYNNTIPNGIVLPNQEKKETEVIEKPKKTKALIEKQKELSDKKAGLLNFLRETVGVSKFKDFSEWQEAERFLKLIDKIGKEEFLHRLQSVLQDPFHARNSNKLAYLRKEIESYIHSPKIESNLSNKIFYPKGVI